jgi:hypothetical protein
MGNVTTSSANNITSPNGNSLALFVDGVTGVVKVKDVMGNIQPLSDYIFAVVGVVRDTYALMIADGTPVVDTIYTVLIDENKSYVRSTYFWKTNGQREWIASTPDN